MTLLKCPQTLSCLSVVCNVSPAVRVVRSQELWAGTAAPGGCRFDLSLVQSKFAHACSNVGAKRYVHAQQISGLMTVSIYDEQMLPAAMCPTNM